MPSAFTPLTYVSSHSSVLIFREATKHPHLIFPLNGPLLSSINKSFNSSETIYLLINAALMSPCIFITYFHLLSKALPLKKLQVLKMCIEHFSWFHVFFNFLFFWKISFTQTGHTARFSSPTPVNLYMFWFRFTFPPHCPYFFWEDLTEYISLTHLVPFLLSFTQKMKTLLILLKSKSCS